MTANLVLVAFLLLVAFFWATQGLFSALLHLLMVIASGALALAFWEQAAYLLLATERMAAHYAWGVSLGLLFVVNLIALRMVVDRMVPKNVQLPNMANQAGGIVLGLASAWLTAGIALLALSFMPLGQNIAGYQPYELDGRGRIVEGERQLWLPVDTSTASFFAHLSRGSLSPSLTDHNFASSYPEPIKQASLFRMRFDPNASLVASPASVEIDVAYEAADLPEGIDVEALAWLEEQFADNADDKRLILADTVWRQMPPTYDGDDTLRVPPTQIRLLTRKGTSRSHDYAYHLPVAFSFDDDTIDGERRFVPVQDNRTSAFGLGSSEHLGWLFIVPNDEHVRALTTRNLRFDLRKPDVLTEPEDHQDLALLIGHFLEEDDDEADGAGPAPVDPGQVRGPRGITLERNNDLPAALSSSLHRGRLSFTDDRVLTSGDDLARAPNTQISQQNRIQTVREPGHLRILRSAFTAEQTFNLFTHDNDEIVLVDSTGDEVQPVGYVIHHSNGDQRIQFGDRIHSVGDIPRRDVSQGDTFYLYFRVQPSQRFVEYRIGEQSTEIDFQAN